MSNILLNKRNLLLVPILAILLLAGCYHDQTYVNVNLSTDEINKIDENGSNGQVSVDNGSNVQVLTNTSNANNNGGQASTNTNTAPKNTEPVRLEIPSRLELDVDFAPQAPFANWDELHEEACEEASIIIVAKYFAGDPLDERIMDEEIIRLDKWEKDIGYNIDLSAQQTADILNTYYGLNAKVTTEVTVDRIKFELAMGNLVIVPAAGRKLENPYFRAPGPIYHMLVIKGYDSNEFITNEVGTKRGDGFKYKYQQLIDAVHDWEPSWSHYEVTDEQMTSQPKRMIVVSQK